MGSSQNWVCWHRNRHVIIPILLVLLSSFSDHFSFIAQATRPIPTKLPDVATGEPVLNEEDTGRGERFDARQIGSRPPQCRRRCGSCGHCVAVQVPVAPQKRSSSPAASTSETSPKRTAYSRGGDDLSNYKPISWKCKCGDLFFNP
ncbi:EPIDERMAL PATTERNING FACTOR-like protein 2 [Argentina anserina]|uniref:EPIDERMAL PATTERNING FACTOR-like protein 2 n=1 Tax=Argentina anserina TaxID=57926 RepID=UPI0021764102|nr:EPIDERMAL PATTERNING FACTOR-like protein 2 [Potentilla anserina]